MMVGVEVKKQRGPRGSPVGRSVNARVSTCSGTLNHTDVLCTCGSLDSFLCLGCAQNRPALAPPFAGSTLTVLHDRSSNNLAQLRPPSHFARRTPIASLLLRGGAGSTVRRQSMTRWSNSFLRHRPVKRSLLSSAASRLLPDVSTRGMCHGSWPTRLALLSHPICCPRPRRKTMLQRARLGSRPSVRFCTGRFMGLIVRSTPLAPEMLSATRGRSEPHRTTR